MAVVGFVLYRKLIADLVDEVWLASDVLLVKNRVVFANKRHRALFTGSVVYIAGSVPLHIYCSYIIWDTHLMTWFPMWFSWFLLIVVYPVFLTLFAKLHYKN